MRAGDGDSHIDYHFECGPSLFRRQDASALPHLRLEGASATVQKTTTGSVHVPPNLSVLVFNPKGTYIARVQGMNRIVLAPPRSLTFVRGGSRLLITAARGEHQVQVLSWPSVYTPLLEHFVATSGTPKGGRQVACKPVDPQFQAAMARFEQARSGSVDFGEPLMLSVMYEVVGRLVTGGDEVQLAAIPPDLPETIRDLTVKVRKRPSDGWPLKDASDMAGYSPFHFSRVFKQLVGYGFHEYVDRCRTEAAVELLCTTDMAVDLVASSCGFGTTQGLRESVKEYLGLVPSELRATPEAFDAS